MVARGWTAAKVRAYRIADNKLSLLSGWDEELLGLELADLREFGVDLSAHRLRPAGHRKPNRRPAAAGWFRSYDETIETEHECPKCSLQVVRNG